MYASDLFSSAFVRWKTDKSFDNVHANPDPLQWQRKDSFFYSMPFPSLETYQSIFSLFNPNIEHSAGTITLYSPLGEKFKEIAYDLKPRASLLVNFDVAARRVSASNIPSTSRPISCLRRRLLLIRPANSKPRIFFIRRWYFRHERLADLPCNRAFTSVRVHLSRNSCG